MQRVTLSGMLFCDKSPKLVLQANECRNVACRCRQKRVFRHFRPLSSQRDSVQTTSGNKRLNTNLTNVRRLMLFKSATKKFENPHCRAKKRQPMLLSESLGVTPAQLWKYGV